LLELTLVRLDAAEAEPIGTNRAATRAITVASAAITDGRWWLNFCAL